MLTAQKLPDDPEMGLSPSLPRRWCSIRPLLRTLALKIILGPYLILIALILVVSLSFLPSLP